MMYWDHDQSHNHGYSQEQSFQPMPISSPVTQQTDSLQTIIPDCDFSSIYNDEQHFLMGLTGLDVLNVSGFTEQLEG